MKKGKKTNNKASTTSTELVYTGKVNLKIIKGNKVVKTLSLKNRGTPLLFKVIASALCGFSVSGSIPRYLDFGQLSGGIFSSALSNRISVTGRVVEDESIMIGSDTANEQIGALFTGYIPNTSINSSLLQSNTTWAFSLYQNYVDTGSSTTQLAELSLSDGDKTTLNDLIFGSNIGESYSIMVEWLMIFTDGHTANQN